MFWTNRMIGQAFAFERDSVCIFTVITIEMVVKTRYYCNTVDPE